MISKNKIQIIQFLFIFPKVILMYEQRLVPVVPRHEIPHVRKCFGLKQLHPCMVAPTLVNVS